MDGSRFRSTNQQPARSMNGLWMCLPNGQSPIPTGCPGNYFSSVFVLNEQKVKNQLDFSIFSAEAHRCDDGSSKYYFFLHGTLNISVTTLTIQLVIVMTGACIKKLSYCLYELWIFNLFLMKTFFKKGRSIPTPGMATRHVSEFEGVCRCLLEWVCVLWTLTQLLRSVYIQSKQY